MGIQIVVDRNGYVSKTKGGSFMMLNAVKAGSHILVKKCWSSAAAASVQHNHQK